MHPALVKPRVAAAIGILGCLLPLASCTDSSRDLPTAPEQLRGSFSLSAAPESIPADGISMSTITGRIESDNPDPALLTIRFTTNAGDLVGGTDVGGGAREVAADASTGIATIQLQSSRRVETAVVTGQVVASGVTRTTTVAFTDPDTSSVIRFLDPPTQGEADGESAHILRVQVSTALAIGTLITFETSHGKFLGSNDTAESQEIDDSYVAEVVLQSPSSPATALVTAKTPQGVLDSIRIVFGPAYPDAIITFADDSTVVPDGDVEVTAVYLRDPGRGLVSTGLPVSFSATGSSGQSLGRFVFPNGSVVAAVGVERRTQATFELGAGSSTSTVTISVSVPGSNADPGTAVLEVLRPPTVDFSCIASGLMVIFRESTEDATSWEWDFGDDSAASTDQNPTYEYGAAGTYTVTLTATGEGGMGTLSKFLTLSGTDDNAEVCP